jgi:hypothetical protein
MWIDYHHGMELAQVADGGDDLQIIEDSCEESE